MIYTMQYESSMNFKKTPCPTCKLNIGIDFKDNRFMISANVLEAKSLKNLLINLFSNYSKLVSIAW